jgi:hypothetical protein
MHLEITSRSFWFMVMCAGVAGVSGLMFGYDSGKRSLQSRLRRVADTLPLSDH